ncbi:phenylalanine--tRNA ligase subunit beta [Gammaproteobacteria bacterium]|nr:phenylalanine--tRNA ligase subunit beta [Gammaproteobacteria bacterium]MDA7709896.1 phenylalanine--tRNA ligase subunit beta [Gammaproteobacteria bacterium]
MKIVFNHLVQHIKENPSIEMLSDKLFQLGHEHEIEGGILDMEFTPNRGDCLSVTGLLRDLSVFYTINGNQEIYNEKLDELSIDFENLSKDICPQISFLRLEIDDIPKEYIGSLNNYFLDLGLNKNNFFTDVSNYLSYETGQPTHCYDASKINGKLVFHELNRSQEFETLLDKKVVLSNNDAVFSLNNNVINLAGVVGGKTTSCSANTKEVIIECAYFKPEAIIGKSVKYDIQSDASHKFERGVDPSCHEKVLRRFIQIISEHATINKMSIVSHNFKNTPENKISVNTSRINSILGININQKEYLEYLSKLSFEIHGNLIKVPSFRNDIKTQNDLAEEVARTIGYDNIKTSDLNISENKNFDHDNIEKKLKYFLLDHGFYEVINSPFINLAKDNAIRVDNPLDSNREFLRTSLTNSLLENLLFNEKRQKDSVKLFEISDVYTSDKNITKKRKLCIIASGRVGLNYEDFSKKINKEYLTTIFKKILPNKFLDFNIIPRDKLDTKINNEIIGLEVEIDTFPKDILSYNEISKSPKCFNQYIAISEQPSSFKDISFSIKDFSKTSELQNLLLNYKNDLVKNIFIFDYFKNEKKEEIKIGFRFIFQSKTVTLTSVEVDTIYKEIINKSLSIQGVTVPGLI